MEIGDVHLWHIYFVASCRHTVTPKPKYLITVGFEGQEIYGFLINSKIRPFFQTKPKLLPCTPLIRYDQHKHVLKHDSYMDVLNIYLFSASEFDDKKHCAMHEDAIRDLLDAVEICPQLAPKYKTMIRKNAGRE